jgi:hypothetical protein
MMKHGERCFGEVVKILPGHGGQQPHFLICWSLFSQAHSLSGMIVNPTVAPNALLILFLQIKYRTPAAD